MKILLTRLLVIALSVISSFSTIPLTARSLGVEDLTMKPTGWIIVDEEALSQRYQNGHWDGERLTGFGHTAVVEDGILLVDGAKSSYPADSSVANQSIPICSDEKGIWFEDHERNEIRHDLRGVNRFAFRLQDAGVQDTDWYTEINGVLMYVFANDGTRITIIDMSKHGVLASTYPIACS